MHCLHLAPLTSFSLSPSASLDSPARSDLFRPPSEKKLRGYRSDRSARRAGIPEVSPTSTALDLPSITLPEHLRRFLDHRSYLVVISGLSATALFAVERAVLYRFRKRVPRSRFISNNSFHSSFPRGMFPPYHTIRANVLPNG